LYLEEEDHMTTEGMPPEGNATAPATPPVADPTQAPAPAPESDKAWLNDRIAQAQKSARASLLEELGLKSADDLKAIREEQARLAKEAEERAAAERTELEQARHEAEQARKEAEEARAEAAQRAEEAETARYIADLQKLAASHGVKDFDYMLYAFEKKASTLAEGEDIAEADYLKELVANPAEAYKLGIAAEAPAAAPPPAESSASANGPAPAPNSTEPYDAFKESASEFQKKLQAMGVTST
jgi:hypothetical protein